MATQWAFGGKAAKALLLWACMAMADREAALGQLVAVRRGSVIQSAIVNRGDSLIPGTRVITGAGALVIIAFEWRSETSTPCRRWDIISGIGNNPVGSAGTPGVCQPTGSQNQYERWRLGEVFAEHVVFWGDGSADDPRQRQNPTEITEMVSQFEELNKPINPRLLTTIESPPITQREAPSLGSFDEIIDVAASYNRDDQNSVVLVATRNGEVHELYYQGAGQPGRSVIAQFNGIVAIAASYNADDQYRIAIVATQDGNVHEVFYHPTKGKGESVIAHFNDIVDVAAFYNEDDQFRVVLVATRDGQVHEMFYHPQRGRGQSVLATYDGIVALAGNFVQGSNFRRALTLTADGRVHELLYHPTQGRQERVVGPYTGLTTIAGSGRSTFAVTTNHELLALPAQDGAPFKVLATMPGLRWVAVDYMNAQNVIYAIENGTVYRAPAN